MSAPADSAFASMQKRLGAEQKVERLKALVADLERRVEYQAMNLQGLMSAYLQAQAEIKRIEQNGLTLVAALVRTAGGTVRVPLRFIADSTGTLDQVEDETSRSWIVSWRPAVGQAGDHAE